MSSALLDKRRLKDRNRNFNPRWEEEFAFINFSGRPLCLICNVALTHFKSCNLKRHYETHHKTFSIEYPPWSERRRKRLLALKISRTQQDAPVASFDEESRLASEAGLVISQACAQNSRVLSEGELCKQVILDVVSILDPLNTRLRQLIDDIPLVRSSWLKSDSADVLGPDGVTDESATFSDVHAASDDSGAYSPKPMQCSQPVHGSLVQHIQQIERATGCFICSACPTTGCSSPFACSDPSEFQAHVATKHAQLVRLVCVYCAARVLSKQFVTHVIAHLIPSDPATTALYRCPYEPACPHDFQPSHLAALQAHWEAQHADADASADATQPPIRCPYCRRRSFTSLASWAEHIRAVARPLVHCTAPGCLVKSPSRSLVVEHYIRKHTDPSTVDSNPSVLIHETFEILCNKPELTPTSAELKSLEDLEMKSLLGTCHTQPGSPGEPRAVFLLRCPHCDLSTVRWSHFLLHAANCPGACKAGLGAGYRCRVYWCSDCQAVSTEHHLVSEHVTYTHKSKAFVVKEQILVSMLDSRSEPVKTNPSARVTSAAASTSATAAAATTVSQSAQCQPLVTSSSMAAQSSSSSTFSGHVLTPYVSLALQPPTSSCAATSQATVPSDDTMGESMMNFAALSRPTRQLLTLTNQTQLTTALPPALPAIPLTPSSITAISLMPSAQVSVSSGSTPVSLFPSAAALKTLQELTGGSGSGVSQLSASEAASAVAAMAAAALTGFTGFDVNSAGLAAVTSQAFPVTLTSIPSSLAMNASKIFPTVATLVSSSGAQTITTSSTGNSITATTGSPAITPVTDITVPTTTSSGTEGIATPVTGESKDGSEGSVPQDNPGSADDRTYPDYTGRVGDDMVSFPFDEDKFRSELSVHIRSPILDRLVAKMRQFSSYLVRILGKENHRRIPVCPECGKVFPYGLGDFKRHLLTVHLEVPREYLKDCLRFTYLPKSEEKFQEVQEQLAMRQMRPRTLEPGRRRVPLPYSIAVLRRLTGSLPVATREFLEQKMQLYSRLSVIVDTRGGFRRYKCNHCSYSSPHALADVRKHILGSHCGISTKHFRHCLQASRLDPVEFTLFSDEKLARLAKEFFHRRQGSDMERSDSRSPSPVDGAEQNGGLNELHPSVLSANTASALDKRSQDTYVSRFTTMVPGSKTPVTVRIRPPVPPDSITVASDPGPSLGTSSSSLCSPIPGAATTRSAGRYSPATPLMPQSPLDSPESEDEFQATTSVDSLDLAALPSIPGLEGADRVVDLELPFSEPVLRQLLESAGATRAQMQDILAKMQIYSTYTMSRICKGDRTLAFRCPCGRLFVTTRQLDSGIRAATLADSRRHVMGVHARISHEFITICCQASRITRDYDFEIYPDEMLLRLAMERPIKVNCPTSGSTANAASLSNSVPTASSTPTLSSHSAGRTGSICASNPGTLKSHKELTTYPPILPNPAGLTALRKHPGATAAAAAASAELSGDSAAEDLADSVPTPNSLRPRDANDLDLAGDERELSDAENGSIARKPQKGLDDPLSHLIMAQASSNEEVERVINLPYSSEALYSLVQGYCPASYFPILEEKMDVYSSLKVFITRRRGRRYFCCSGCSSSSPHGMGDIRKHILGVHAKVPERYKAAAMHCSRLSREDNTLLPNHVLLHLAKMKWKGTVIKPLAEMDLSQFGTRRASAVGLARPPAGGQFASQVYQPSTQHRDTEKLTALHTTSTAGTGTAAKAPSKPAISHTPEPGESSPLLDDLSSSSLFPMDHSIDLSDLSSSEEPYIIRINTDQCIPDSATADAEHSAGFGWLYICSLCQYTSSYVGASRAHVVRVHMSSIAAYQCPHCETTYNTRKEAQTHHQASHAHLEFGLGEHLPMHRAAMARIRIRDVDQEPAVVATSLKTLVREGKIGPNSHHHHGTSTTSVDEVGGFDLSEDATLFENEVEDEDGDEVEDEVASCAAVPSASTDAEADVRPAKMARFDTDRQPETTNKSSSYSLSNGQMNKLHEPVASLLHNGGTVCSASPSTVTVPRVTLSGSSRRKPSKLQLVQLKPSSNTTAIIAASPSCDQNTDDGDRPMSGCSSTRTSDSAVRWHLARSRSPSPDPSMPSNLMVDVSEAS